MSVKKPWYKRVFSKSGALVSVAVTLLLVGVVKMPAPEAVKIGQAVGTAVDAINAEPSTDADAP